MPSPGGDPPTTTLRVVHTADLDAGTRGAARALLDAVFGDEMTDHDWEHALGGLHALLWHGSELIGHAAVVQRRLLHRGRPLRAGYVEAVVVHAGHRRRGHGGTLMDAIERVVRSAYDLGALGASDEGAALYRARGWAPWRGPTYVLAPEGTLRTEDDDDSVHVLDAGTPLDLTAPLTCDWREGDVW